MLNLRAALDHLSKEAPTTDEAAWTPAPGDRLMGTVGRRTYGHVRFGGEQ